MKVWLVQFFCVVFFTTSLFAKEFTLPNAERLPLISGKQIVGELQGVFAQGGAAFGHVNKTFPVKSIKWNDTPIRLTHGSDYTFILGFNRNEPAQSILEITFADGTKIVQPLSVVQREYEVQNIKGLPKKKVNPPKEFWDRIKKENSAVGRARKTYLKTPYYNTGFIAPTKGIVTGVYGTKRVLNGEPKSPHYGIDIAAPAGTLVYAPADGVITMIHEDMYYTGKTMVMDHGQGLSSTFLHMQKILVLPGQKVTQGEVIGKVGSTGRSTGPHLDWRMNVFKARIDPAFFVPSLRKNLEITEK